MKSNAQSQDLPIPSDNRKSDEDSYSPLSLEEVAERLRSNVTRGLDSVDAAKRLAEGGANILVPAHERSAFEILFAQFRSLIVALLVVATTIAFAIGETTDAIAILIVILLNAGIGFFTELKARQALEALQKQSVRIAHVIRDGGESEIPAADLVPGDLVRLATGARVPADGRIVESIRLQVEESALTGESLPVEKTSEKLPDEEVGLGDRVNMAFLGTTITDGRGAMLVTATGARSEVGKIGRLIDDAIVRATPLEQKLGRLSHFLLIVVTVLCSVIILSGWLRGGTDIWHMLEIGLSLAIAAVPEGLLAVTTMTLALGMQRMARKRALVRRLSAVETLGAVTVICTDKTGTLTKNEMTVCVYALDHRRVDVSGLGYKPEGTFRDADVPIDPITDEHLALALRIGVLCNNAKIERSEGTGTILGDPTEGALIVAAEKAGMQQASLLNTFPRLSEVPFDSMSKRMLTVHSTEHGKKIAFLKGAPGELLSLSSSHLQSHSGVTPLSTDDRQYWERTNRELASSALRVLGLAYRELPDGYNENEIARDLVFVGLVGMSDPVREEAKSAIAICREAGIRTVMITGDQEATASEIARQLGIDRNMNGEPLRTIHSRELKDLDASGWQRVVADAGVFVRVSPEHKLRIVEALQQQGHIVAMTGDGVNDAPALKKADIGIAMGIKGTEVAKENADMVITDDNFTTIVEAVEQGRTIYGNILRFLHYLLSCNFAEIVTVFLAMMIGWPLPLVALQILWLNLITDILPAFALALEPASPGVMKRLPRDPKEPLIPVRFLGLIVCQGILLAGVTLLAFSIGMRWNGLEGEGLRKATTMAFMTLAQAQIFHTFNARSQNRSAFTSRLFSNGWLWAAVVVCLFLQLAAAYVPLLQRVLQTVPPTIPEWGVVAICSLVPVAVVEVVKRLTRN